MLNLFRCSARVATLNLTIALSLVAISCSFGRAQNLTSTASLSGIVADQQGNRIVGATVTILSGAQDFSRTFKTDASGTYSFSVLPPAVYSLTVEAPGFKKFVQNNITLEVGQAGSLNISLTVGSQATEVEVTAETPLLSTDNANLASEINEKQITEMPLNLRNPVALVFLDSSVKNIDEGYMGAGLDTSDEDISFLTFGGEFQGSTAFVLDGTWNTAIGDGMVAYVPSVDSVQEFKVQTNSFTAQYGLSTGNVVNLITKSGTDKFHGDAYDFFRNDALDANYYFNNYHGVPRLPFHMNQFGVTGGGPLYIPGLYRQRDRTFFFALYEGVRQSTSSTTTLTAPTSAFKSGDLSALFGQTTQTVGTDALGRPIYAGQIYNPQAYQTTATTGPNAGQTVWIRDPISNNNLSALINPVSQKLLQYFPSATNSNEFDNFYAAQSVPFTSDEFTIRIDHNLTKSARLYGRFSKKLETKTGSGNLYGNDPGGPGELNPDNRWSTVLGYNQTFSPTLTGTVNFGVVRWVQQNVGEGYGFKSSTLGLPAELDSITPLFPAITFSADVNPLLASLTSAYTPLGSSSQATDANNLGTLTVDIIKVHGTQTLSFGYMGLVQELNGGGLNQTSFAFNQGFTSGPDPTNPTEGTGDAFGSFLLGNAASGSTGITYLQGESKNSHGWYFQDDWRATRRLTLNLGLRYDIQLSPTDKRNRQAYFDPDAVNPISAAVGGTYHGALVYNTGSNRGNFRTNFTNFAPRFGFAYQALRPLVVRGGYGIFYPSNFLGNTSDPGYSQGTSYVATLNGGITPASNISNPFPSGILPSIGSSQGGLTDVGQNVPPTVVYNRKSPYTQEWSFGFQYSPTTRDVFETSYVGNHALHVAVGNGLNLNELPPQDLALGNAALIAPAANPFYGQASMAGSSCGLNNPTVPAYQLMLPMPQFCDNVGSLMPALGFSTYNALDLRYTHRAQNLTVLGSYTYSKWIDDATSNPGWNDIFYTSITRNNYDLKAEKAEDEWSIPNAAVISLIYQLPVGRGRRFGSGFNRPTDALLGGWQVSSISTFKQGTPIGPQANGVNEGTLYGGSMHPNIVGNPNVAGPVAANPTCTAPTTIHTVEAWFNPCAFEEPSAGTFGDAPRYISTLRTPGYDFTDLAIEKWFQVNERVRAQFRSEMFNAFNHPIFGSPFGTVGESNMGVISYADISRQVQFALKFYW
jgi:hypothetical protein